MTEEKNSDIKKDLDKILSSVSEISQRIDVQAKKMSALESRLDGLEGSGSAASLDEPPPPPPPDEIMDETNTTRIAGEKAADKIAESIGMEKYTEELDDELPGPDSPPEPEEKPKETQSMEEVIGGRWFAKIGIAALVLGIAFFLKYAFDNNWIGEVGRVLIGVFAGLTLLGIGEKTIRKYSLYGQLVSGGGLAVLYLSVFAAYNFYDLITIVPAFCFMGLVTLIGVVLSLRYNAPALIIVAVLGGFATPFLIPSNENLMFGLFGYIMILDLAVLIISFFKQWRWLNLIGFVGTFVIFSTWYDAHYSEELLGSTMIFLSLFFLIYSISPLLYNIVKKVPSTGIEQVMTLLAGVAYFSSSYGLLEQGYHHILGVFTMLLAIYYFLWAYIVKDLTPSDSNLYNFLAFLTVGFVTVAIPIQFKKFVVTILWAVEAGLLAAISSRLDGRRGDAIKIFALFVFGLAAIRMVFVDGGLYNREMSLFINEVFISGLFVIAAAYITVFAYGRIKPKEEDESSAFRFYHYQRIVATFLVIASMFTVFSVTRDIIEYSRTLVHRERVAVEEYNRAVREERGNHPEYMKSIDREKINNIEEKANVFISMFWLIYAAAIVFIGMYFKRTGLIVLGASLNIFIGVKLLVYDLWGLDSAARSFIALANIVSGYIMAVLFGGYRKVDTSDSNFLRPGRLFIIFVILANIFTIFWVSREIVVHYDKIADDKRIEMNDICGHKRLTSANNNYNSELCKEMRADLETLRSKASISISIFWMIYAIILSTIGFVKRNKWLRMGGMLLLFVSIFKLFFIDLWNLGQLYRIIASISLGVVLLGISFAYQKHKEVFKELIND